MKRNQDNSLYKKLRNQDIPLYKKIIILPKKELERLKIKYDAESGSGLLMKLQYQYYLLDKTLEEIFG